MQVGPGLTEESLFKKQASDDRYLEHQSSRDHFSDDQLSHTQLESNRLLDDQFLSHQASDDNLESNQVSKDHSLEDQIEQSQHLPGPSLLDENHSDAQYLNDSHQISESPIRKIHTRLLFSGSERPLYFRSIIDGRTYDQRGIEEGLFEEQALLEQREKERRERERTVLFTDAKGEMSEANLSEGFERLTAVEGLSGLLMRAEGVGGRKLLSGEENIMSESTGGGGGNWRLASDKNGLERSFKFKTFKTTWVRIIFTLASSPIPLSHSNIL